MGTTRTFTESDAKLRERAESPAAALARYRENRQDEIDSAAQYRAIAELTSDDRLKKVFSNLERMEEAHISFWDQRIRSLGGEPGERRPSWRSRVLIFIARKLGPQMVLSTIAANEAVSQNMYVPQAETSGTRMTSQEHWHTRVLNQLLRVKPQGFEGGFLARMEGRHRAVGSNALRAAVLGANDGLCSNLSLVMGAAGASSDPRVLLITGLAGLLAGAFSMALGEWVSVTSSRELAQREIRIEADELRENPEGEGLELQLIYEAKGFSETEAKKMASRLLKDESTALDTLAREELGLDPEELGGSPWEAAITSFLLFAVGAFIPVLPLMLFSGGAAVLVSIVLSGLGLFLIGAAITIFTGQPVWKSGSRQLLLGLAAATITFALGRLVGASLS